MLKRENLRKNLLRVRQIAEQNLGRAEKSEVLSEDLQTVEKRVELVKHVLSQATKKLALATQGDNVEKRLKKLPETGLAHSLIESAGLLGQECVMGQLFQLCGECEGTLAGELLQYELNVEQQVQAPLTEVLENDIPAIAKLRKQLTKLTLDMDSARSRWHGAVRGTQAHGVNMANAANKADTIKEELEEACNRVEQAKDAMATEMFNFIAKEADHSHKLLMLVESQATYHRTSLQALEKCIPKMRAALECNPTKPVYGVPLEEHLRVTDRDIAMVIEACACTLLEMGMEEEGLFRIAGMASKVKKLKASFDAGIVDMEEYGTDVHTVAGTLKQYLRELPEPLLTYQLYPEFVKAAHLPTNDRLQALWVTLQKLPPANYNNFRYLIKFLARLADKSDVNKMNPSNISIVIGPNLLWSEGDNAPSMLTTGTFSAIIEAIILNADWFFPGDIDFGQVLHDSSQDSGPVLSAEPFSIEQPVSTDWESTAPDSAAQTDGSPYSQLSSQDCPDFNIGLSPSATPAGASNTGTASGNAIFRAPLAESEENSRASRMIRRPAPPPPERPFSVNVTASVVKPNQSQTWPRQTVGPIQSEMSTDFTQNSTGKPKSIPPERPAPPEKPHIDRSSTGSNTGDRHPPEKPNAGPHIDRTISAGIVIERPPGSQGDLDDQASQGFNRSQSCGGPSNRHNLGGDSSAGSHMERIPSTSDRPLAIVDRPLGPPPERPKIPPPVAPHHQRSASTGNPGAGPDSQPNGQGMNKSDSLYPWQQLHHVQQ